MKNERDWLTADLWKLQDFIFRGNRPKGTGRKMRLCAAATCRLLWPKLRHPESKKAVEVAELSSDGLLPDDLREGADTDATMVAETTDPAARAAMWVCDVKLDDAMQMTATNAVDAGITPELLAALTRDIFGNPFRPVQFGARGHFEAASQREPRTPTVYRIGPNHRRNAARLRKKRLKA